jgi:hypothetical protein
LPIAAYVCSLVAVLLCAADPGVNGKGTAELQGTWKLVSVRAAAGAVELPDNPPLLTISQDRLLFGGEEFARLSADSGTAPKVFGSAIS